MTLINQNNNKIRQNKVTLKLNFIKKENEKQDKNANPKFYTINANHIL